MRRRFELSEMPMRVRSGSLFVMPNSLSIACLLRRLSCKRAVSQDIYNGYLQVRSLVHAQHS